MALKQLVELAFARVVANIETLPTGTGIFTGEDDETQTRPCVVCHCTGGTEEPQASGNRMMTVNIICKSQADDPEDGEAGDAIALHTALVTSIEEGLKVDELSALLIAAIDGAFYAFDPVIDEGMSADPQGRAWTDNLQFKVYCCAVAVA